MEEDNKSVDLTIPHDLEQKAAEAGVMTEAQRLANEQFEKQIAARQAKADAERNNVHQPKLTWQQRVRAAAQAGK